MEMTARRKGRRVERFISVIELFVGRLGWLA